MVIYKQIWGYILLKAKNDVFVPQTVPCTNWKHWKTTQDPKACAPRKANHGQIYAMQDIPNPAPPLHPNCRCVIEDMDAAQAGMCSREGQDGADWWLRNGRGLPNYYIFIDDLENMGWERGTAPAKFAPGKMVDGGIYHNRNGHRVLYSNDGLMFVTYDHYETFIEVIGG